MNALGREIKDGEEIVLNEEALAPEYRSLEWRTVTAEGGFGASSFTAGRALFVRFKDGDTSRVNAMDDISVSETNALTK